MQHNEITSETWNPNFFPETQFQTRNERMAGSYPSDKNTAASEVSFFEEMVPKKSSRKSRKETIDGRNNLEKKYNGNARHTSETASTVSSSAGSFRFDAFGLEDQIDNEVTQWMHDMDNTNDSEIYQLHMKASQDIAFFFEADFDNASSVATSQHAENEQSGNDNMNVYDEFDPSNNSSRRSRGIIDNEESNTSKSRRYTRFE